MLNSIEQPLAECPFTATNPIRYRTSLGSSHWRADARVENGSGAVIADGTRLDQRSNFMTGLLMDRREFLLASLAFSSNAIESQGMTPLRLAHRQANMVTAPGQDVLNWRATFGSRQRSATDDLEGRGSFRTGVDARVQTSSQSQRD
jgi:hypothetical protein